MGTCADCVYLVPIKRRGSMDIRCWMCGNDMSEYDGTEINLNCSCPEWEENGDASG